MAVEYSDRTKDSAEIERVTSLDMLAEHGWKGELERLVPPGGDMAELTLGEPYRVQYLSLESFLRGASAFEIVAEKWRRFLLYPCLTLAEIEFDREFIPITFYHGPGKDGLRAAMEIAGELEGHFRGSVVLSPALKLAALHLTGDKDLLIPFPPNVTPLENYQPIATEKASEMLQGLAKDILSASEREDETGG
ncbi:hypothetical protein K3172_12060 [Qipengyuania sp. 6B39]|uniref:hypothetical protein n=1 Tax=Qipengyuania proteolytica TaxID=2867239 RepID=UPI001C896857|nr:hypothetical protein [Qipengyuania proteolytica]MBX7496591.1 hypothetical protein [Qipengyuania proteolytica]